MLQKELLINNKMKNIFLVLLSTVLLLSCGMSKLVSVDRSEETTNHYYSIEKTILLDFNELTTVRDDNQYGNIEIEVPEITNKVIEKGAVLAYIQRPATENSVERWSQFPQYSLVYENPTYSYLSYGLGFIRISLQSSSNINDAANFFKGKKIKLVILE